MTNEAEAKRLAFYLFYTVKEDFSRWVRGGGDEWVTPGVADSDDTSSDTAPAIPDIVQGDC